MKANVSMVSLPQIENKIRMNNQLHANQETTLQHEEWLEYDRELERIARHELNIVQDAEAMGLVRPIALGTRLARYERVSTLGEANVNMNIRTGGDRTQLEFKEAGTPVPCIWQEWELDMFQLEAHRNSPRATPLDTEAMSNAAMDVAHTIEKIVMQGDDSIRFGSEVLYGLTNHPNRLTEGLSAGWAADNPDNAAKLAMINDIQKLLQKATDAKRRGTNMFNVYVASNIWQKLDLDYNDQNGNRTIKQRIEAFADVNAVKYSAYVPDDKIVVVRMARDSFDIVMSMNIRNFQWQADPFCTKYATVAILAPRVKLDYDGNVGVVQGT